MLVPFIVRALINCRMLRRLFSIMQGFAFLSVFCTCRPLVFLKVSKAGQVGAEVESLSFCRSYYCVCKVDFLNLIAINLGDLATEAYARVASLSVPRTYPTSHVLKQDVSFPQATLIDGCVYKHARLEQGSGFLGLGFRLCASSSCLILLLVSACGCNTSSFSSSAQ